MHSAYGYQVAVHSGAAPYVSMFFSSHLWLLWSALLLIDALNGDWLIFSRHSFNNYFLSLELDLPSKQTGNRS